METVHIPQHVDPTVGFFPNRKHGHASRHAYNLQTTPQVACTHALGVEKGGVPEFNLGK